EVPPLAEPGDHAVRGPAALDPYPVADRDRASLARFFVTCLLEDRCAAITAEQLHLFVGIESRLAELRMDLGHGRVRLFGRQGPGLLRPGGLPPGRARSPPALVIQPIIGIAAEFWNHKNLFLKSVLSYKPFMPTQKTS